MKLLQDHTHVIYLMKTQSIYLFSYFSFSQVTIESFTLGRFVSYTQDGCPDGYLQISESARTPVGGMWCGTSWGPVMFFSETRTLIFAVKLWR